MITRQLSVFVENKPGRLAEITAILAREGVDIRAVTVSDTTDFGILRLILNDPDRGCEVLRAHGCTVSLTSVIIIKISDQPGGLAQPMKLLYENGISVEYMYAFLSKIQDSASVILRVDDCDKAIRLLSEKGITLIGEDEIRNM
ncbi:MAG: ACT domain-containing protein [Candidatus Merdivicinus sp.]|jgi:hypothetical protein